MPNSARGRAVAIIILVTLAGGAATIYYSLASSVPEFSDWPRDGQVEALNFMDDSMKDHDCAPQFEPWSKRRDGTSFYKYHLENEVCQKGYTHTGWKITEASATAFFRCDIDHRFADYAVTVYRNIENFPERAICEYTVLPNVADKGVTSNVLIREPIPRFPNSPFNELTEITAEDISKN